MRSKAPLVMMEQMVMLLVFALAAALCVQAFVRSDAQSKHSEARDRAVLQAQTVAETLRSCGGDFAQAAELLGSEQYDEDSLLLAYAPDWTPAGETMRYLLGATRQESSVEGLGRAQVWVRDESGDGAELFRLDVAWQEVLS